MAKLLSPSDVASADYPIAQSPVLGGECEVYMSLNGARLLGILTMNDDVVGNAEWDGKLLPTSDSHPGPILAVVQGQLRSDGTAATVTYGGKTVTCSPSPWSSNQGLDFPVGRAFEFDIPSSAEVTGGAIAFDGPSLITTAPTITHALRGTKIALIEMPVLTSFKSIGVATDQNIKLPTNTTKFIAKHLESSYWTTPGKTEIGTLDFKSLDLGYDDGLSRFAGLKVCVLIKIRREQKVIVRHEFYLDYVPSVGKQNPEGDGEAILTAAGSYSRAAIIPAN